MSKFGRFSNRVLAGSLAALTFSGPNVQAQGSNYQPTATYATPVVSGDRKNGNHVVQAQAAQPREEKSALPARTSSSARVNTAQRSEFNQATTATPRADSRGKVKAHDRSRQQVNHEGKSFGASNGGSSMADMSTTERIASDNRPHAHAVPVRHTDLVAAARAQEEGVGFRIKRNEGRTTNPETQARKMTDKDNERYICRKRNSQRKVKWDNQRPSSER